MYILPQFLEIETKKLLKFKLSEIIADITDDFIENLFIVNSNDKYQNIMLKFDKNIRDSALKIIKETIEIMDNLFLNCNERKQYFNVCNKYQRSIFTIFGWLDFERIYYYDKYDRTKHFYFIDHLFKFPTYEHYDSLVKAIAIDNAISTNQKKELRLLIIC